MGPSLTLKSLMVLSNEVGKRVLVVGQRHEVEMAPRVCSLQVFWRVPLRRLTRDGATVSDGAAASTVGGTPSSSTTLRRPIRFRRS